MRGSLPVPSPFLRRGRRIAATARFNLSLPLLVALVVFALMLLSGPQLLADPDTYLHIAAGRWMIAHQAVPHADPFSHSMPGAPWIPHEWLSQVVIALAYDACGWAGPVVIAALVFAAAMAAMTRCLLRFLEPAHALAGTASAWAMCAPHLLARPHLFGLLPLALWLGALVEAREEERAPAPRWALLMALWANLHGGFVLGLALAALLGGEALVSAPTRAAAGRAARQWAGFGALSLAAAAATPNLLAGLWLPFHLMGMHFALGELMEWQAPNFETFQPLEAWLMLALLGALAAGLRLPWTRLAMVLLLFFMALSHRRNSDFLGIAAPFLLAAPVAAEIALRRRSRFRTPLDRSFDALARPASRGGIAAAAVLSLALAGLTLAMGVRPGSAPFTPKAALAAAAAAGVKGPVLNDYGFGGYLIFSGIAPFIDGRIDMYGDAFMRRYVEATQARSHGLRQLLDDYHITWTLLAAKSPGAVLLDHMPGWRRLYADDVAVVHVRER